MVVGYRPCHVTRQIGPDDDNGDDDAPRMRRDTRPLHQRGRHVWWRHRPAKYRVFESHQSQNSTTNWQRLRTAIKRRRVRAWCQPAADRPEDQLIFYLTQCICISNCNFSYHTVHELVTNHEILYMFLMFARWSCTLILERNSIITRLLGYGRETARRMLRRF